MVTPSLVMVGAPHFLSMTTLRPRGPSVTLTASASALTPRSRERRAVSSNSSVLAMGYCSPFEGAFRVVVGGWPGERPRPGVPARGPGRRGGASDLFSTMARTSRGEDQVLLAA